MNNIDYERNTRTAYNRSKAESYKKDQTEEFGWIRFATWREKLIVGKSLRLCNLTKNDKILDIPCGTGIMGSVVSKFPASVVASDISEDMMNLAIEEYNKSKFGGFVKADITNTLFERDSFACVLTIGLMHRLPLEIRHQALKEIRSISKKYIIISYSVYSPLQKFKRWFLKAIKPSYKPSPAPISMKVILDEIKAHGLRVKRTYPVVPFLSSEIIFLLEKIDNNTEAS